MAIIKLTAQGGIYNSPQPISLYATTNDRDSVFLQKRNLTRILDENWGAEPTLYINADSPSDSIVGTIAMNWVLALQALGRGVCYVRAEAVDRDELDTSLGNAKLWFSEVLESQFPVKENGFYVSQYPLKKSITRTFTVDGYTEFDYLPPYNLNPNVRFSAKQEGLAFGRRINTTVHPSRTVTESAEVNLYSRPVAKTPFNDFYTIYATIPRRTGRGLKVPIGIIKTREQDNINQSIKLDYETYAGQNINFAGYVSFMKNVVEHIVNPNDGKGGYYGNITISHSTVHLAKAKKFYRGNVRQLDATGLLSDAISRHLYYYHHLTTFMFFSARQGDYFQGYFLPTTSGGIIAYSHLDAINDNLWGIVAIFNALRGIERKYDLGQGKNLKENYAISLIRGMGMTLDPKCLPLIEGALAHIDNTLNILYEGDYQYRFSFPVPDVNFGKGDTAFGEPVNWYETNYNIDCGEQYAIYLKNNLNSIQRNFEDIAHCISILASHTRVIFNGRLAKNAFKEENRLRKLYASKKPNLFQREQRAADLAAGKGKLKKQREFPKSSAVSPAPSNYIVERAAYSKPFFFPWQDDIAGKYSRTAPTKLGVMVRKGCSIPWLARNPRKIDNTIHPLTAEEEDYEAYTKIQEMLESGALATQVSAAVLTLVLLWPELAALEGWELVSFGITLVLGEFSDDLGVPELPSIPDIFNLIADSIQLLDPFEGIDPSTKPELPD